MLRCSNFRFHKGYKMFSLLSLYFAYRRQFADVQPVVTKAVASTPVETIELPLAA